MLTAGPAIGENAEETRERPETHIAEPETQMRCRSQPLEAHEAQRETASWPTVEFGALVEVEAFHSDNDGFSGSGDDANTVTVQVAVEF